MQLPHDTSERPDCLVVAVLRAAAVSVHQTITMPAASGIALTYNCPPQPIQVLGLLLANLPVMPAVQQPLLFQRLLPLVAAIPSAAERTRGLAHLWSAVLRYDWSAAAGDKAGAARAARAGAAAPAPPAPQLQQLLLEPHIKEAVAGVQDSGNVAAMSAAAAASSAPAVFPAFREELVGSLLYVLLSHAWGAAGAAAPGAGGAAAGASSVVAEAGELQALLERAEWLASAKIALQVGSTRLLV